MKHLPFSTSFAAAFLARVAAAFGGLALSIVIARLIGLAEMGIFAFALSILHFATIFSRYGLDMVLWRTVARRDKESVLPLLRTYLLRTVLVSLLVLIAVLLVSKVMGMSQSRQDVVRPLMLALPFLVGTSLFVGYLRGVGYTAIAALCETGGLAGLTAIAIGVLTYSTGSISVVTTAVSYSAICLVVFAGLFLLVRRIERDLAPPTPTSTVSNVDAAHGARRFWIVANALFLSQAGALLIGGMVLTDIDIGNLRLAERLGLMASFAVTVTDQVMARFFARDHDKRALLKRHFLLASSFATCFAIVIAIFIIVFDDELLGLAGEGTQAALPLMYIYLAGSVFNALTGTSSMFLSMTGDEKFLMHVVLATFVVAMPSFLIGSTIGGAMGFAVAYLLILILKNSILFFRVLNVLLGHGSHKDGRLQTGSPES